MVNREDAASGEARYADIDKSYKAEGITIRWQPQDCIHVGECFRRLGTVFQPRSRPWVIPDAAPPDEIADTILHCPSGALHFLRTDGGPQEMAGDDIEISPVANGPLYLRGRIRIEGPDGRVIREDTRVALCRCGASENKPFCDNSHRRVAFQAEGR